MDDCRNKDPTCTPPHRESPRAPTAPRLKTNVNQNIVEATEVAPIFLQGAYQVIFHPDNPEFAPPIIIIGVVCPALLDRAGSALAAHALTDTATPNTATPAAIRSGKINSHH